MLDLLDMPFVDSLREEMRLTIDMLENGWTDFDEIAMREFFLREPGALQRDAHAVDVGFRRSLTLDFH